MLYSTNEMKQRLGDDNPLLPYLIPTFAVGCRRPTPGNGYLEALTKQNVRVVTDPIAEIVPDGIKLSTNEVIKVDMFICATGFDISFCPRYPITGLNGVKLGEKWSQKPEGYMSLAVDEFPNHFSKYCGSFPYFSFHYMPFVFFTLLLIMTSRLTGPLSTKR